MIRTAILSAIAGLNGLFCLSAFICAIVVVAVIVSGSPTIPVDTPEDNT